MEIKVKYQGEVVGVIDFKCYTVIERMKKLGYESFWVRSQVTKYEYFALFKNEDTEEDIRIYPDKSIMKTNDCYDCKVTHEELYNIKIILDYCTTYRASEEESD